MRIAVSGSHGTGKSTLVSLLARHLPNYAWLEEPYHAMLDQGHAFESVPSFQDFEELLERSLIEIGGPLPRAIILDRCPIDYLAYLVNLTRRKEFLPRSLMPEVRQAMSHLDLVVYVPIERPERVPVHAEEGRGMRSRVDETIREMLVEDGWGFGVNAIEVQGTPEQRCELVLARLADME